MKIGRVLEIVETVTTSRKRQWPQKRLYLHIAMDIAYEIYKSSTSMNMVYEGSLYGLGYSGGNVKTIVKKSIN